MPDQFNTISLIVTVTALMLFLSVFIISMLYLHQKKQFDISLMLEDLKQSSERTIIQSQLEIQEQTLQQVSREIHDNISLNLSLSKIHLCTLDYAHDDSARDRVQASIELIGGALVKLSALSRTLNSDLVRDNGLLSAIADEIAKIKQLRIYEVEFAVEGNPVFLPSASETVIFRIIQESLNNILKHANATKIAVLLDYDSTYLGMKISDNGSGFTVADDERLQRFHGCGLRNIKHRTSILKGEFNIRSSPGQGTTIAIQIPLTTS